MPAQWGLLALPPAVPSGVFAAETMLLLPTGDVLVHNAYGQEWLLLKPDPRSGYAGGTWGSVSQMSVPRGFFASGVLKDGRVFVVGGETSGANSDISSGDIYDPSANVWVAMSGAEAPPDYVQGDASACILADGRVIFGGINDNRTAIWDPAQRKWTAAGTAFGTRANTKYGNSNEETWTLLRDGSVITVNTKAPNGAWSDTPTSAERYIPEHDIWQRTSATPEVLPLTVATDTSVRPPIPCEAYEIGPAIMLPSGKLIAFGATGHTAIYDPATAAWTRGGDFPRDGGDPENNHYVLSPTKLLTVSDAPACLLPNGRVLAVAGTLYRLEENGQQLMFSKNSQYFQYDAATNALTKLAVQPPDAVTKQETWVARFLVLPTGQVLLSTQQRQVFVYTPDPADGNPALDWRPTIADLPAALTAGQSYTLTGTLLGGLSQANSYGDDAQMATNYPIAQITDTIGGAVQYLHTRDFSTLGVAVAGRQTCTVAVPATTPPGSYTLAIIANGIASAPKPVDIAAAQLVG